MNQNQAQECDTYFQNITDKIYDFWRSFCSFLPVHNLSSGISI